MKAKLIALSLFAPCYYASLGQSPIISEWQKKIKQEVEAKAALLKQQLIKEEWASTDIEFSLDTFRIERFMEKSMDIDNSDAGMVMATNEGIRQYDNLLNKYYKKLEDALKGEDKKALVQAEKAWLTFRDKEISLIETVSLPKYSGGGTLQGLVNSSQNLELIKTRTIQLYNHLTRIEKDEE